MIATKREIRDAQNKAAAIVWRDWKPYLLPTMIRSYPSSLAVTAFFMLIGIPRLWTLHAESGFGWPFAKQIVSDLACAILLAAVLASSSVIFEVLRERKAARRGAEQALRPRDES
ncbi:MAG TPA: hypothetical protein VN932_04580 [Rhizomicrobium sp.]|nr:hypothetical protein [Rhizomicrobium sp.]